MKARIFCPTHGRLELCDVVIKNGEPLCGKCSTALEYGDIRPRNVEAKKPKKRK
jgi:hypothetical protein